MIGVAKYQQKIAQIFIGAILCFATSCSGSDESSENNGVIVSLGESRLTYTDLQTVLPGGLTAEDSTRFARAYINSWIETHLVSLVASSEIDMSEIDKLTEKYRNELIMLEYRRQMFNAHADSISDDMVNTYYENHKQDFVLDRPFVKGIYIKVPDDAKNLKNLQKLYLSDNVIDIDKLEKEVLSTAIHYDYFRDKWVDWEQIETRIPYDFGSSPTQWLRGNKSLNESLGGFTYLLKITDVLPVGSTIPIDVARPMIVNRLQNINRQAYDKKLMRDLYDHALATGDLQINISLE